MSSQADHDILFDEILGVDGCLGLITLNRPSSLNALTLNMCIAIDQKLAEWQRMSHIKAVVVRGEGERGFCAGGDLRYIYSLGKSGAKKSSKFFYHEYRMNHRIFHFPKPFIALMHGITMGGGVGISVHGSHRVGAEDLLFAMPETGIGFFPDVGGSYFLPRCTSNTGVYMALTGAKLHIADALYAGVVDHLVPKESFESLISALLETRLTDSSAVHVSDIINSFSMEVDSMDIYKPHLVEHRAEINQCFSGSSIEQIMESLSKTDSEWCQIVLKKILEKSPTSLKVTLKELQLGSQMNFNDCLQMEYRIAMHFLVQTDFYEGIRSAIIDKDRNPAWKPDNLEDLPAEYIDEFFESLANELSFENEKDTRNYSSVQC